MEESDQVTPSSSSRRRSYSIDGMRVELLYCKSKCYLHPTSSSKDNIPGFLTLTRQPSNTSNIDIVISFVPENLLSDEERAIYEKVDMQIDTTISEHDGTDNSGNNSSNSKKNVVYINKPLVSSITSYSFGITISNIYSVQVRAPSVGWWWGSIIFNSKSMEKIPIVFFHDDESPSTIKEQELRNKDFNIFSSENGTNELFWGGDQFLKILKKYCVLEKSSLENTVFLVNPTSEDMINFVPPVQSSKKEKFNFNTFLNNAKWKILETLANVTNKTRDSVKDAVDEAPEPIKAMLLKPEVRQIVDDFDSSKIYLAKWAMGVQEEAERSRKKVILDDYYTNMLKNELGTEDFKNALSPEEVSRTRRIKPISKVEWESFFDHTGRFFITVNEIKERIFHGGVDEEIRPEVWLFLFEVYPWDSSRLDRTTIRKNLFIVYSRFKNQWEDNFQLQEEDAFWQDQKFRIDKDINRCDRNIKIFKYNTESGEKPDENNKNSDGIDDEDDEDVDITNIKNPHLKILRNILITYNEYNQNLGYVQGMTDLLAPIYYILRDESLSFWCFTKFMIRMERNFLRDQSGMRAQMNTLNELVQFMLPELYIHLEKADSNNLFFFFRMLLVWFKREFQYDDVLKLWEVLLTDYYSSQFHLCICLGLLSKHEKIIMKHLDQFDQVLKYFNDLSMMIDLDDLLVRSELLFLRFRKMVDIIDREASNKKNSGTSDNSEENPISDDLRRLLSKKLVIQREGPRPPGVMGG
ncbi:hypothetical protein PACTADRAFT_48097 [Pachysolen tannophilus NRRL Y-2460]|uniref:GTPase-activating protein GYP7 n=1 Tax=Pachysolen tannophilus NRRL Y-2460 TaxID=669874 RepID=A0A1E4U2S8_PACTA|nr:hypothetical protein PACTADRAFT_48097 [Pachysolen tannophilus NRRL Y-2460]